MARLLPFGLAAGAMAVAFSNQSIGGAFTFVLNLTAGIGPVLLLRWFWWRINPWSEIAALSASLPVLLVRPHAFHALGWPAGLLPELLFMVLGTALVWVPATLLTPASDPRTLAQFYALVRPPGWWRRTGTSPPAESWASSLRQWGVGTVALLAATVGPLQLMLGQRSAGWIWCGVAAAAWTVVLAGLFRSDSSA